MKTENKNAAAGGFSAFGKSISQIGTTFVEGDWKTRLSYLIFGFGPLARGQIVKGLAYLASEIAFILYMVSFGADYLSKITTLGTVETAKKGRVTVYGDNSFLILLFGLLTIILIGVVILIL